MTVLGQAAQVVGAALIAAIGAHSIIRSLKDWNDRPASPAHGGGPVEGDGGSSCPPLLPPVTPSPWPTDELAPSLFDHSEAVERLFQGRYR